jgi:hypothetical protein
MRVAGGHMHIHQGFEYNNVFHSVISLENPAFTKLLIGHELFICQKKGTWDVI